MRDAAAVGIARAKVAAFLKSAEPPSNNNITQEKEEALKELKRNPEITQFYVTNLLIIQYELFFTVKSETFARFLCHN